MSRIDALIAELCPDGVEFKTLGEGGTFRRGTAITEKETTDGTVPVVANGPLSIYSHGVSNRTGETIVVSRSGAYAGLVSYWDEPIFLTDAFSFHPDHELLQPKFVYYFLQTKQEYIHAMKKGSGVPHVRVKEFESFAIPVPPIEVQREIVKVLDTFTEMEAELEAELEARRRQYEYYRSILLEYGDDVPRKRIDEVMSMRAGNFINAVDIHPTPDEDHTFPCFGGNGLRGYVASPNRQGRHVLIGRQGAWSGNVRRASGAFYATEHAIVATLGADMNADWVFHMFTEMNLNQYVSQGAQPGLAVGTINSLRLPIPSLTEQERTAKILNKFDALVNDLSIGLPAELNARRQQYEYYRDKLLTFEERTA